MDPAPIHTIWILTCSILVFLMQVGFMCLESGLTRSKNSINVAIKNLTDFALSILLFWALGFALMFGSSLGGWLGAGQFLPSFEGNEHWIPSFFLFQMMFCATAGTIFSGAVAERMSFRGYIVLTLLISGFIYPIFGHWAWRSHYNDLHQGWLEAKGFIDYAGSTVVHSVGGWFSLAALLVIGPRKGRFLLGQQPKKITGSNVPMSVLGVFFLWIGWFGFNGGSTFAFTIEVAEILINTVLAGSSGGLLALTIGWSYKKVTEVNLLINGSLAGLVAVTASCHVVGPSSAVIIGAIGALIMLIVEYLLEQFKIDDAVNAVPIHLGAGIWGTIAVALFANSERLDSNLTWLDQVSVQLLGIFSCAVWSFVLGYILLRIINKLLPLRVTAEQERIGLNVSQHGSTTDLLDLLITMDTQAKTGDLEMRVPVEPFTEVGQIAERYNQVMEALQKAVTKTEAIIRDLRDGVITFTKEGLLNSFNPGAENIFGYSSLEVIGQRTTMILAPISFEKGNEIHSLTRAGAELNSDSDQNLEFLGIRKDQTVFPVELSITKGEIENEVLYTGLIRDITDQKKAEKLATKYQQQLEMERENLRTTRDSLQARVKELSNARRATLNILHDHEEMRKKSEEAEKRFRSLNSFSPVGIFEAHVTGKCIYTNPRWTTITGLTYEENIGEGWLQAFHQNCRETFSKEWKSKAATPEGFFREVQLANKSETSQWARSRITALRTNDGKITGYVGVLEDITENKISEDLIRASLNEKETLLREIHHRVKNNLQVISSLLNMQASSISDQATLEIFKESQNRIRSMALIHEKLYSSRDLAEIKFDDYLKNLTNYLLRTYRINVHAIELSINVESDIFLTVDTAIPCGLIINELLTNSLKYAFSDDRKGKIHISLCRDANKKYSLKVRDNGVGIPDHIKLSNSETLGLQIVATLTRQLDGEVELDRSNGTSFTIGFREPVYKEGI